MTEGPIYLDHAATTPVRPEVLAAIRPYFDLAYGNPSSVHEAGQTARRAVEAARKSVAAVLGCRPAEIVFTSGGTESDNLAIRGVAYASRDRGRHIVTTTVEHHAVLHTCQDLERHFGFEVTYVDVDSEGLVDPDAIGRALRDDTILVSVMLGNNEVGTIEPVAEIAGLVKPRRIPFHTDAVQGAGMLDLSVDRLGVDLLTLAGHKFYAPKGIGILYARRGTPLHAVITGGEQERNRRSGTENVPGIVGFARALELVEAERTAEAARLSDLRDRLIQGLLKVPGARLTGPRARRLPGHASFCFEGVNGETVLVDLEQHGIQASSGSACAAGSTEPSHVLQAMGIPSSLATTAVRLTLGRSTTQADVDRTIAAATQVIGGLRSGFAEVR